MRSQACYAVIKGGNFSTFSTLKGNANFQASAEGGTITPCLIIERDGLDDLRKLLLKGQTTKALEALDGLLPRVYSLSEAQDYFSKHSTHVQCVREGASPIVTDCVLEVFAYYSET